MASPLLEERREGGAQAPSSLGRIGGLDTLRGGCIILMIAFHFVYDLYFYAGFPRWVIDNPVMTAIQVVGSGCFILLAGFSSRLSRSNLRRGAKVFLCGVGISVVTWFWGDPIRFGILQFMGSAMMLYGLTRTFWERLPKWPSFFLYIILFTATKRLLPMVVDMPFLYPLGFVSPAFRSSDYFPLLPWFFLFLTGSWLGQFRDGIGQRFRRLEVPGLNALGRHSLGVYLLHQPVLVLLAMGLALLTGRSFSVG